MPKAPVVVCWNALCAEVKTRARSLVHSASELRAVGGLAYKLLTARGHNIIQHLVSGVSKAISFNFICLVAFSHQKKKKGALTIPYSDD